MRSMLASGMRGSVSQASTPRSHSLAHRDPKSRRKRS